MTLFYADTESIHQYPARAREVRSCDIIVTPHSPRHLTLEVQVVRHETFRNPEGQTLAVVRYDGWELFDGERWKWVERGWGQAASGRVIVVGTTRRLSWALMDAVETARIFGPRYPS